MSRLRPKRHIAVRNKLVLLLRDYLFMIHWSAAAAVVLAKRGAGSGTSRATTHPLRARCPFGLAAGIYEQNTKPSASASLTLSDARETASHDQRRELLA